MKNFTINNTHKKYKKLTVLYVGAGYGEISIKDNVAKAMSNRFTRRKSISKLQKEKDTHPCSWGEVYQANRVDIAANGGVDG